MESFLWIDFICKLALLKLFLKILYEDSEKDEAMFYDESEGP